ncbi:hypothetical protein CIP101434_01386 [Corynebacterium diphtheriae]|nr:hypothetical protein CIP101280_01097 [Corynebacterium diphtheriae]CAB0512217.1 hypothetical protein CIP101434_01386 [Corynebacterium diphtheriae]CAB0801760.1 hypothetical protein FRC0263_01340 [Corynebacterium diphtheriae]CAB0844300.1 hypothetical protein FRC0306_01142 [Corynebacterium diphtheriae]CAB0901454.1 hypothetical protein FRC0430_00973 [Corynebacterium diphtheriae]
MPAIDPNDLAIALKVMRIASDLPEDDEQSLQLQRSMSALPTNNELMMKRQVFSLCRVGSSYALWETGSVATSLSTLPHLCRR